MTSRTYHTFSVMLEAKQDLHIGTGVAESFDKSIKEKIAKVRTSKQNTGKEKLEINTFASTAKDMNDNPIIPVTAMKGVWKRAADSDVWGHAKDDSGAAIAITGDRNNQTAQGAGQAGRLWLDAATFKSAPKLAPDKLLGYDNKKGTFFRAHNRMDDGGVTQLYFVQYVAAGTKFELSGRFDEKLDKLEALLSAFTLGFVVGGRTGKALGHIQPDWNTLGVKAVKVEVNDGVLISSECDVTREFTLDDAIVEAEHTLTLTTTSPFYIRDPFRLLPHNTPGNNDPTDITAAQIRRKDTTTNTTEVELTGDAIKHTLRAMSDLLFGAEDVTWDPAKTYDKASDELDVTERLFGVTGWRGLLRITAITQTGIPEQKRIHGVKLSPWTQATAGSAKFLTEAWFGHGYTLTLSLDGRAREDDHKALATLLDYIEQWGIELGAETNAGFGWFGAQWTRPDGATSDPSPQDEFVPTTEASAK